MTTLSVVTITNGSPEEVGDIVDHALREIGADEHVIVTTDNHEKLARVARNKGAEVVAYEGEFDYSSPRNLGMEHADGDWFLHLDTDERMDSQSIGRLPKHLVKPEPIVWGLLQFGRSPEEQSLQGRLFRRDAGLQFRGLVHETVFPFLPIINANLLIKNGRTDYSRIVESRGKLAVKEAETLLEEPIRATEDDVFYFMERALGLKQLLELTSPSLAEEVREYADALYRKAIGKGLAKTTISLPAIGFYQGSPGFSKDQLESLIDNNLASPARSSQANLIGLGVQLTTYFPERFEQGMALFDEALQIYDSATVRVYRALAFEYQGFPEKAKEEFRKANELFPENPLTDLNYHKQRRDARRLQVELERLGVVVANFLEPLR